MPKEVRDELTTVEFNVVPERVPAGATTALPLAAVINPLALTVKEGMEVEEPKLPTFPLTVANVATAEPGPVAVTSPVKAVIALPETLARATSIPANAPAIVAEVGVKLVYVAVSPISEEPASTPPESMVVPEVGICDPSPLTKCAMLVGCAAFHVAISAAIVLDPVNNRAMEFPAEPGSFAWIVTEVGVPGMVPAKAA